MFKQRFIFALVLLATLAIVTCRAQDDDYEGYGPQGGGGGGGSGGGGANQNDNEGYQNGYGNGEDGGYSGNMPNGYQQNVDPESSNNNPSSSYSSPQGNSDADSDYEGDDGRAAASSVEPTVVRRVRRSTAAAVAGEQVTPGASEGKVRVKRHGKYYIGPVYTYVKTDKHANFKWGVKHKVGKKHHG